MSNHVLTYRRASDGTHYATCGGGGNSKAHWSSGYSTNKQDVEDEVRKHMRDVEIARASLGGRTPALVDQRDHYRRMEQDPHVSEMDRRMWKALADELDQRLGVTHTPDEQTPLF